MYDLDCSAFSEKSMFMMALPGTVHTYVLPDYLLPDPIYCLIFKNGYNRLPEALERLNV